MYSHVTKEDVITNSNTL